LKKDSPISALVPTRYTAAFLLVALFIIILTNPSPKRMKNNAQNYIISQESNIAEGRVQLFLDENFGVNNYLLCSASHITYQNKQYFTGIGFLAYAKPTSTIYEIFLNWEKSVFGTGSPDAFATFVKLNGNVNIRHVDKIAFNDAFLGENIFNKDSIRVGQSPSFSAVQYIDSKSIIKIRENTIFQLNQYISADEINLVDGIIINDINNNQNRLFSVKTSLGVASVKGTVFAVKLDQSKGEAVFVGKTGKFEVQNPISGQVLTVEGMQKITSTTDGDFDLEPATISDFPIDPTALPSLNNNYSLIRKYDFERLKELSVKDSIQTAVTLFNANLLQYPLVTSNIIQIIEKSNKINILPLYRDGFFIVSDENGDPIGYIDEFDIKIESDQVLNQIKEYSSNNFLDSKTLITNK
tara:strand:+ start:346 stop:1578 length:1233 start_codon:yes stop_codon:yes gene_type:complete